MKGRRFLWTIIVLAILWPWFAQEAIYEQVAVPLMRSGSPVGSWLFYGVHIVEALLCLLAGLVLYVAPPPIQLAKYAFYFVICRTLSGVFMLYAFAGRPGLVKIAEGGLGFFVVRVMFVGFLVAGFVAAGRFLGRLLAKA